MINTKVGNAILLMGVMMIVFVGALFYMMNGSMHFQAYQATGGAPAGYQSFPLGTLKVYLKDASNPTNAITTSTIDGKVYDISVSKSAIVSPMTPYLDSADIATADGSLSFTAKKIYTGKSYWLKVWDNTGSPTWYPALVKVDIPPLDPNMGASATYTAPDIYLDKIGTIADPMQSEATGAGGGSLQTGVTSSASTNTITINVTAATDSTITIRIPVTFADTAVGTKIKDVVLKPVQDTTNPMSTTAFTSAVLTYDSGTNLNLPGDILSYVSNQLPINLGDWTDSVSSKYYLQVSLDKSSLSDGDTFYFRIDDLGNWLGTDDIAGQSGASSQYIKITCVD